MKLFTKLLDSRIKIIADQQQVLSTTNQLESVINNIQVHSQETSSTQGKINSDLPDEFHSEWKELHGDLQELKTSQKEMATKQLEVQRFQKEIESLQTKIKQFQIGIGIGVVVAIIAIIILVS